MNVGELFATLSLNDQPFRTALDAAEGSLKAFRSSLAAAAEAAAGLVKGAAIGGAVVIGGALTGAAAAGLSFNNSLEQTTAQLQAMTKDAAKTEAILQMIKRRAAETPFAFSEMASAAASLLPAAKASGAELEELIALAEILAASNPAQGLEGAAFALREALSGDFVSVVERFNLPRSEINRLKEEGVPALENIRQTLAGMGLDASIVSAQAKTLQGRWGRVKDILQQLSGIVTQPIFDAASDALGRFADLLERNLPALQRFAELIAKRLRVGLASLQPLLGNMETAIPRAFGAIGPLVTGASAKLAKLTPLIKTAKTALVELLAAVRPKLNELVALFGVVKGRAVEWFGAVSKWVPAVRELLETLTAVALSAFRQTVRTFTPVIGILRAVFSAFVPLVKAVISVVAEVLERNGREILAFFLTVRGKIGSIIVTLLEIVSAVLIPLFTSLTNFIRNNQKAIVEVFGRVWKAVKITVLSSLSFIEGVLKSVLALIRGNTTAALANLANAFGLVRKLITGAIDELIKFVPWVGKVKTVAVGLWNTILPLLEGLLAVAQKTFDAVGQLAFKAASRLVVLVPSVEVVKKTLVDLWSVVRRLLEGIGTALQNAFGLVGPIITDTAQKLIGFLPSFETVKKAFSDFAAFVQPVLVGVGSALRSAFDAVRPAITNAAATLIGFVPSVETVKAVLADLWVSVQPLLNELSLLFAAVKNRAGEWFSSVGEKAPAVKELLASIADTAAASFRQTAQTIASVIGIIRSVFDALVSLVEAIVSVVVGFFERNGKEILAFFLTVREKIGSILVTLLEIVATILIPLFTHLADFIRDNQEAIVEIFSRVWKVIEGIVIGALSLIEGLLKSVLALLKGDTETALAELENAFSAAFEGIKTAFLALFDWAAPFVEEQIKKLTEMVTGFFNSAVQTITELPEKIKGAVSSFSGSVFEGISSTFQQPQLPQLPIFGQPNQTRTVNVTVNAQYPSSNRSLFDDVALVARVIR